MALTASVTVDGLKDLEFALQDLTQKESRSALRSGLRAGGKIVEDSARANLAAQTSGTGLLASSLRVRSAVRFGGGLDLTVALPGFGSIGIERESDKTQGRLLVKVGTYKPAKVAGSSKKFPHDPYYARWVEFGTRFMVERPFLAPALEANVSRVVDTLKSKTRAAIERLNRRK